MGGAWAQVGGAEVQECPCFFLFFFGVDQENIEWGSLQTLGISMSIANSSRDDNLSERVKNSRKKKKSGRSYKLSYWSPLAEEQ